MINEPKQEIQRQIGVGLGNNFREINTPQSF